MTSSPRLRRTLLLTALVALASGLVVGPAAATGPRGPSAHLTYLSGTTIAAGATFGGTVVGGLSSLTYDAARGVYYALSDDQGRGLHPDQQLAGPVRHAADHCERRGAGPR